MGNLMKLLNIDANSILGTKVTNINYTAITFSMLLALLFNNSVSTTASWSLKYNVLTTLLTSIVYINLFEQKHGPV